MQEMHQGKKAWKAGRKRKEVSMKRERKTGRTEGENARNAEMKAAKTDRKIKIKGK